MGWIIFASVVVGTSLLGILAYLIIRNKLRKLTRTNFGLCNLPEIVRAAQEQEDDQPKSLSGGDSIFMPRILRDFPDFNLSQAKSLAAAELRKRLSDKAELKIHKIILHDYQRAALEKAIVFQAGVQYRSEGRLVQTRYCLHYAYLLPQESATAAGRCPHCGAPFTSTTQTNCPYCGSLVANVLGNTWKFTDCYEK